MNVSSAWLEEHENASLPLIRSRMEIVTGLILGPATASEYFQVYRLLFSNNFISVIIKLFIHLSTDCQLWYWWTLPISYG